MLYSIFSKYKPNTVYCKLFEVEKFRGFRRLIVDHETFPAKLFQSSFKLEYHGRTLQEENRTVNAIYFELLCHLRFHVSTQLAHRASALP